MENSKQEIVQLRRRVAELERLVKQLLAPKSKPRIIAGEPGITNLRLNGNDLQYYKNGEWTTWHTGTEC